MKKFLATLFTLSPTAMVLASPVYAAAADVTSIQTFIKSIIQVLVTLAGLIAAGCRQHRTITSRFDRLYQEKVDPSILPGVFHKQMAIIHPLMNGNKRTTRLVTKILLAGMGLNTFDLFSFENYYNQNVANYFQMIGEFGDHNELVEKTDFTS